MRMGKTKREMREAAIKRLNEMYETGPYTTQDIVVALAGSSGWVGRIIDLLTDDEPQYEGNAYAMGPRDAGGIIWFRGDMSDSEWGVIERTYFDGERWMVCGHDLTAPWVPADSIRHAPMRTATQREDDLIELIKDAAVDYCLVAASEGRWHQLCNEFEEGYVTLPKDANDEVIHIGDELTNPHHAGSFTVEAIGGNGSFPHVVYFRCNNGKLGFHYTNQCHHYHKPTVEDVLREFSDEVRRCCDTEDTIAEYAAKLKEAMAE